MTSSHHDLAASVARDGIDSHAAAVAALVAATDPTDRNRTLLAILSDVTQPAVARERALGGLLRSLARPVEETSPVRPLAHATAA